MGIKKHQHTLTETINNILTGSGYDPKNAGLFVRTLREGLERTTFSIALDPDIEDADKTKFIEAMALLHKGIADAYSGGGRPQQNALPKLKSNR